MSLREKFERRRRIEIKIAAGIIVLVVGSIIPVTVTGEYDFSTAAQGQENVEIVVEDEDTTPPKGTVRDITIDVGEEITVDDVLLAYYDSSDVTYAFKEEPDLSHGGVYPVVVVLSDEAGNTTELTANVTVIEDTTPPVIEGVMTLDVFLGDAIAYKSGITVTDDYDDDVELTVDTSQVDMDTPGTYEITYTATDSSGNSTSETTYITINEKPENNVDEEVVLGMAQEVLDEITTEGMTKKQTAKAIYDWCSANLRYIGTSEKDSWTNGAYVGFTTKEGDCFTYFSTAKALLTQAGIPNIDVEKSDTSHSRHYWSLVNVGDGWYHFDITPRRGNDDYFFLVTDDELEAYSSTHGNSHIFDHSLYPATPTEDSSIE